MTQKRPIVVAGNGPSLARIDYRRLPKEFDTYRVNTFFLEETYYLGRNVTYYNTYYECLQANYPLIRELAINSSAYSIEQSYLSLPDESGLFQKDYPLFGNSLDLVLGCPLTAEYFTYYRKYFGLHPTAGVFGILFAVALGYKEIFVTGIDFFENKDYAFDINKRNDPVIIKRMQDPEWSLAKESGGWHSSQFERDTIVFFAKKSNAKLYALVENSKLAEVLPMAPVLDIYFQGADKKPSDFMYTVPETQFIKKMNFRLQEEERIRLQEEERIRLQEEERIRLQEEERIRLQEEERIRLQEEERIRLLEEERVRLQEEERIRLLEEERVRLQEEERIRLLEEERIRLLEEKSNSEPKGIIQKIKFRFYAKGMQAEWNALRENIYLRLVYHAVKPLWIAVKYIFTKGGSNER